MMITGNIDATVTDPPYGRSMSFTSERTIPTASINAHSASILVLEIEFGSFVTSFVFDIKKPPKICRRRH
jgi:tRNA G10  N-methylase Trm11